MSLEDLLKERIREGGPITVADYMALVLTHPTFGYYMRQDPFGVQGDFVTAPEISQAFGEVIGAWLVEQWRRMGEPKAALVELGPGRGTLMADALRVTRHIAGFHEAISVHLVEVSPVLRQKQWHALAGKHEALQWHDSIDGLPELPLLLIANEFFDALPIRQFLHGEDGWRERMVGLDEKDRLCFIDIPVAAADLPSTLPSPSGGEEKMLYEYCDMGVTITDSLSRHIATLGGAGLIIDYGYSGQSKNNRGRGDTLQTVREHQYHNVLEEPGTADLTAHVDFEALKEAAIAAGATAYGPIPQGVFLSRIGAGLRTQKLCENASGAQKTSMLSALERLTSPYQMGDLFKALCITPPGHPTPEGF